jgi:hypothetical protein
MVTTNVKTGVDPAVETLCISSDPSTMDTVWYNIRIMNLLS